LLIDRESNADSLCWRLWTDNLSVRVIRVCQLSLQVDQELLFELILAANYMDVKVTDHTPHTPL